MVYHNICTITFNVAAKCYNYTVSILDELNMSIGGIQLQECLNFQCFCSENKGSEFHLPPKVLILCLIPCNYPYYEGVLISP